MLYHFYRTSFNNSRCNLLRHSLTSNRRIPQADNLDRPSNNWHKLKRRPLILLHLRLEEYRFLTRAYLKSARYATSWWAETRCSQVHRCRYFHLKEMRSICLDHSWVTWLLTYKDFCLSCRDVETCYNAKVCSQMHTVASRLLSSQIKSGKHWLRLRNRRVQLLICIVT